MKINKVATADHLYLEPLGQITKPPKAIHFIGNLPGSRVPTIAIIGTRKPTTYGREVTEHFASSLAKRGLVIVSGLALGVDALAHSACIESHGTTIAVLANPLPNIQPASNRNVAERILQSGGAIISEHGPGEHYTVGKWSFLERNRIVAGISDAILITEATAQSGTINTAARALEQGKEVFVIPGNITSPNSAGCNLLIKQGAVPVTTVEDILEVLLPGHVETQTSLPLGKTQLETKIIELIAAGTRDGDIIQQTLAVDIAEFNTTLTMMEIEGLVRSLGSNQWSLR